MIANVTFVDQTAMTLDFSRFSPVETEHERFDYFLRDMFLACDSNVSEITHSNSTKPTYKELFREVVHHCVTLRDPGGTRCGSGSCNPYYENMFTSAKYADFMLFQPMLLYELIMVRTTRMFIVVHFPPTMRQCSCKKQRAREESGSRFGTSHLAHVVLHLHKLG